MKIEKLRLAIDELDQKMLNLLANRTALAKEIGKIKHSSGQQIYAPQREKNIIANMIKKSRGKIAPAVVESVFREIIHACRAMEDKIKVAYFGPEATFTHQAAIKNFGVGAQYMPKKYINEVFMEVEKGLADYGVVPIENSTEGMVNHTLDMFLGSDLQICSEISLKIEECLLCKTGKKSDIKKIYSHPQPLGQCKNWLQSNMPNVQLIEMSSTAEAAKAALRDRSAGAIGSDAAAAIYGLKICQRGIEDGKENITRFLVIGKKSVGPSRYDKTSIMLSVKDRVGALYDILLPFKKYKINLTKIESRPTKKKAWEYIFFIDFIGHISEPNIAKALKEIEANCGFIKVLGSYPRAD
ncbi:MAG: prephenate dehydratase [Endomicrobiales bacterium]|nr:prephenate dehydratase [Endomicrobiales bacterium]